MLGRHMLRFSFGLPMDRFHFAKPVIGQPVLLEMTPGVTPTIRATWVGRCPLSNSTMARNRRRSNSFEVPVDLMHRHSGQGSGVYLAKQRSIG